MRRTLKACENKNNPRVRSTVLIMIMAAAIALMYLIVGKRGAVGGVEGGGLA